MKTQNRYGGYAVALIGTLALTASAPVSRLPFQPESRLWVDGTSTVRSWTCKSSDLTGNLVLNDGAGSVSIANLESTVRTVEVSLSVEGLKCGNDVMDGHLQKALKSSTSPKIRYQLTQHKVAAGAEQREVDMSGTLQLAGQEKPISMKAVVARDPSGALRVRGTKEIAMTDFGIKAPTLMMGTMKVGEKVTVGFDVLLKQ